MYTVQKIKINNNEMTVIQISTEELTIHQLLVIIDEQYTQLNVWDCEKIHRCETQVKKAIKDAEFLNEQNTKKILSRIYGSKFAQSIITGLFRDYKYLYFCVLIMSDLEKTSVGYYYSDFIDLEDFKKVANVTIQKNEA